MSLAKLKIRLLGEFQLQFNEQTIPELHADRPQSLLAYLLLHRHTPQSRQHLAFLLWPDSSESQARTNLRNLLFTLRHALPEAESFLLTDNLTIQWNINAPYDLDVANFECALDAAKSAENNQAEKENLENAAALYRGDLLPGNYDDWLVLIREDMRQQYQDALGHLVDIHESSAGYRLASRYCRRLWQQDTLDESTAIQLMRLLALSGDRAGVQRVFQTLSATLLRELGVDPSIATQEAYSKYRQEGSSQQFFPAPFVVKEWQPRQLQLPGTPFIGREKELADIAERLAEANCRLLTVFGLSGMGKTRLVLQAGAGHQAVFKDGVAYAALSPIQSAESLAPVIAEALNLPLSSTEDSWSQLGTFLQAKHLLLVLDNIDYVITNSQNKEVDYALERLVGLLQSASQLKLLVTARQRLDLIEEWAYEIQGLAHPNTASEMDVTNNSSVTLFINSARRIDHQFALTDKDLEPIIQICNLVDGMPLGIELAASWVRLLSCTEIMQEITHNINFLRTEMRNVPLRHRSIRVIFDHSWEILDPSERDALARLSALCGVFSREMAEQEAGAELATLSRLVNKSLLNRIGAGQFKLHNLVRQYAALRLHDGIDGGLQFMMPTRIIDDHHSQMESGQQSQMVVELNDKHSIRTFF